MVTKLSSLSSSWKTHFSFTAVWNRDIQKSQTTEDAENMEKGQRKRNKNIRRSNFTKFVNLSNIECQDEVTESRVQPFGLYEN